MEGPILNHRSELPASVSSLLDYYPPRTNDGTQDDGRHLAANVYRVHSLSLFLSLSLSLSLCFLCVNARSPTHHNFWLKRSFARGLTNEGFG